MRRNYLVLIILILTGLVMFSGCTESQDNNKSFDIPEADKIQKILDDMSAAVMENNTDMIDGIISESCPRHKLELDKLKSFMDSKKIKSYSQTIVAAKRLKDGVVCTVSITCEESSGGKNINNPSLKNIYFIFENGTWKIGDYNYYPYANPTIVVGSESELYNPALSMSDALNSKLRTDAEHLQTCGDIILVGTPYDNASILDLEEKGLTSVKVTDNYPGNNIGIVQVLSNIEDYRYVVIIQGSNMEMAENSIDYMTQYLKDNPYLNTGVYFIEENSLRNATPLELTTLVTLDINKSSERLKEVQKHMEANISVMEEELLSEKSQLLREQRYVANQYIEDYSSAFSRYEFYPEQSLYDSMVLINANYTDSRLCTSAFRLPYGNSSGTAYAYADYTNHNIELSFNETDDGKGPLLIGSKDHTHTAHEIYDSGSELEISCLSTAILRLIGFSADEVYSITADSGNAVFINIDAGYAFNPGSSVIYTPELQLSIGDLLSVYNEAAFLSYENNWTNLGIEETSAIYNRAAEIFKFSGRQPGKEPEKVSFRKSELEGVLNIPYDSEYIYSLLRKTFITDDTPCRFSTLDEAREQLRSAMGSLLAIKCTSYITNTASRYPLSQFDYARYAAGLINVEHPNAYAEASSDSELIKDLSGGISNLLSDAPSKTQKIIDVISDISDCEKSSDMFSFPDYCIANKTGSHWDKALLAFGLYGRLTGDTEDTYIALGESSSYLVFKEDDEWKYLDCRYNTVKDYIDDDIYAVFNKDFVYNKKLDIGDEPDFMR